MNAVAEWLTKLAIARSTEVDEAAVVVYVDALRDVDPELVVRACLSLSLEPRELYETALPSVATIRARCRDIRAEDAQQERQKRLAPPPAAGSEEPTYFCLLCHDDPYNWRPFWCPGTGRERVSVEARPERSVGAIETCTRLKAHGPHDFVDKCTCRDVNPVSADSRRRMADFQVRKAQQRRAS